MEPEDEEAICPLEEVPVMKKRRKKQKRVVEKEFLLLPEESVTSLSSETVDELNTAYKIFQIIMGISKIEPFLDKPNENLFGMSSYYNIIKKPMWLYEVERKLFNKEYDGIGVFVSDIRLILENCYRFWGPTHKFSRKALYIEHKLELQLTSLPESLKEKCFDPELNANEIIFKTEKLDDEYSCDNEEPIENVKDSVTVTLIKGFESKILNRVLENDEPQDTDDIEEQNRKEAEMLIWEKEHLVNDMHKKQIESMWQLAEIGSFLKLTFGAFNVEEISQYEVERMFLMPKESTTLATLMTSMLSPQMLRSQLDDKPVMPYEIWTFRLKRRIDHWLSVFYTSNDETEAFNKCGVDAHFWSIVNLMNPLEENSFHEISFFQRVWIFKSLCDNVLHSEKAIQDIFLDGANVKELRAIRIGGDKKGNIYFRIPFFQEIRVYRQTTLPESVFQTLDTSIEDFYAESLEITNQMDFKEEENDLEILPSEKDCKMVADSVDSLKAYIKVLRESKQHTLAKHFSQQLKLVKNERRSIEGLMALYTQWHDYQNRSQEYFAHILSLWLANEKPAHAQNFLNSTAEKDDTTAGVEVLGKRRVKPNQHFDYLDLKSSDDSDEQSGEFESSDGSDWESTYRHKKKKKVERKRRRKRASSESRSEYSEEMCNSDLNIQEVISIQEEFEDIKPDISQINIKIENGNMDIETPGGQQLDSVPIAAPSPYSVDIVGTNSNQSARKPNLLSYSPSLATNSIPEVPIKIEKDDIICISSDEEVDQETKTPPINTAQNKMKNGIPLPNPVSLPTVIVRTPSPAPVRPQQPVLPRVQQPALPRPPPPALVARTRTVPQPIIPIPLIPQPIKEPPMPQPIPAPPHTPPRTSQMPLPIPIPATTRQMPLPIPEPTMPQPIVEPPMPQPMPQTPTRNWSSPRNPTTSPRVRGISPRLRSPLSSPVMRTPSPRSMPMRPKISPVRSPRNPTVRNLFPQTTAPPPSGVPTVEGVLEIGQKPDGSYGYHVKLPDGGIINMSRLEIDEIRRKNNGVLPVKVEVPLTKNKKF